MACAHPLKVLIRQVNTSGQWLVTERCLAGLEVLLCVMCYLVQGPPALRRTVRKCSQYMVQVLQILKNDFFGMQLPLGSLCPISLYLSTGVEQFGVFLFTLAWPQCAPAVSFRTLDYCPSSDSWNANL